MADEQFATAQGTPKAEPDGESGQNGSASDGANGKVTSCTEQNGAASKQQENGDASREADMPENAPDIKLGADNDDELPCEVSHGLTSDGAPWHVAMWALEPSFIVGVGNEALTLAMSIAGSQVCSCGRNAHAQAPRATFVVDRGSCWCSVVEASSPDVMSARAACSQ